MLNHRSKSQLSIGCVGSLFCGARVGVFEFSGVFAICLLRFDSLSNVTECCCEPDWSVALGLVPSCQNYVPPVSSKRWPTFELCVCVQTTVCQNTLRTEVWLTALVAITYVIIIRRWCRLTHWSNAAAWYSTFIVSQLRYSVNPQADNVPPSSTSVLHECALRIFALTIFSPNIMNRLVSLNIMNRLVSLVGDTEFFEKSILSVVFIQQLFDGVGLNSAFRLGLGETRWRY
jgi:hypothetical protein